MINPFSEDSFTEQEKQWLQSKRDSNPSYKYLDNSVLYRTLRNDNLIPSDFRNKDIDKNLGYTTPLDVDEISRMKDLAVLVDTFGDLAGDYKLLQTAYERSLTGQTRRMLTGESKFFDVETQPEDELTWYNDILASAMSFSMPLDAITMGVGHRVGGLAARGRFLKNRAANEALRLNKFPNLENFFRKRVNKKLIDGGYRGLTLKQNIGLGALEGAFPLAFYEGAMGYVEANINNQDPTKERMDVASHVAKKIIHGGALGAITGGTTAGVMSKKAILVDKVGGSKATKEQLRTMPFKDKAAWRLGSAPGTIAIESGIFTGIETLEKIYNGQDVRLMGRDGILATFGKNAGLFGVLRAKKAGLGGAYRTLRSVTPDVLRRYSKSKISKAVEGVESNMAEKYAGEVSEAFNTIKKDLSKTSSSFNEKAEDIIRLKNDLQKDLKYLVDSVAKGKKHFEGDAKAIAIANNASINIANVRDQLKRLNLSKEEAPFLEQQLKDLEIAENRWESVNEAFGKSFNETLKAEDIRSEAQMELVARDKKTIPFQGREVSIYDTSIPAKKLQEFVKKLKGVAAEKAGIVEKTKAGKLDERLGLVDVETFKKGISGETGEVIATGDILKRRREFAPLLSQKSPFKTNTNASKKFNESFKYIDNLIQNVYPELVPVKGATRIQSQTVKNQVSHLKQFAEYLAKKGKSFTEATRDDIRTYLQEPGKRRSTHDSAINRLVKTMKEAGLGKEKFRNTPAELVKSFTKKILTEAEVEKAQGLKPEQIDIAKGEVRKQTTKKGVYKEVPISSKTKELAKKVNQKYKTPKDEGMFRDSEGKELYQSDLNSFVTTLLGPLGKGKSPARKFRDMIKDFYTGRPLKIEGVDINPVKFINDVAMGQNTLKQLDAMYGIKPGRAKQVYKKILNDFTKALSSHISGKAPFAKKIYGVKEEGAYSFLEVANALKGIVKGQGFKAGKLSIENKKTKEKFQIDKDMAEFMFRYMLEVPSRLNEIVRKRPTKAAQQALEVVDVGVEKIERIEKNIAEEAKNMSEFDKTKLAIERKRQLEEIKKEEAEFKQSGEYKKRLSINVEAKKKESNILKLQGKKIGESLIRDAKLDIFGVKDLKIKKQKGKEYLGYEIKNEKGGVDSEKLDLYNSHLENIIKHIENPGGIAKTLRNKGFNDNQIKDIAVQFGVKNGDITKLNPKAVKHINSMIKDLSIGNLPSPDEIIHIDPAINSGASKLLNWLSETKKLYVAVATKLQELDYKTKGPLKKTFSFLSDATYKIDHYKTIFRGENTVAYNKYIKSLEKALKKDMYWHNSKQMKEIIDVVDGKKKVSREEFELYKEMYDKNIKSYENKLKEGTVENISYKGTRAHLDKIWNRLERDILEAHKDLKLTNPSKYEKLVKELKDLREPDYFPEYVKDNVVKRLEDFKQYDKIFDKTVNKILRKKAEKRVTEEGIKQDLNDVINNIKKRKTKRDTADWIAAKQEARNDIKGQAEAYNLTTTSKPKELMARTNKLPLVMTDKTTGEVFKTRKDNAFEIFGTYFLSSANFGAVAKIAPEYLQGFWKMGKGRGEIKSALNKLDMNLKSNQKGDYNYVKDVILELVGAPGTKTYRRLKDLAYITSMTGLSGFVEPGFKNFLLGQAMIISTHGTSDYVGALINLAGKEKWNKAYENAVRKGAIDYVVKELGEGAHDFIKSGAEKVYNFSGMTKAENINRIIAIETAKISGQRYMQILSSKGFEYTEGEKNEAARFLKETARATQEELRKIETGEIFKSENSKEYNYFLDKLEIWGHRATQGGVELMDLPRWMNKKNVAPFFVFQRIATSVTGNMVRNIVKPALNHGNFAPLFRFTTSSYLSGHAQYELKKMLFPVDDPQSLGNELDRAIMKLWKAEFLGMFGSGFDLISPQLYNRLGISYSPYPNTGVGAVTRDLQPGILRLVKSAWKNISSLPAFSPKSTLSPWQMLKNLGQENIVLYSQIDKLTKTRLSGKKSKEYSYFKDTQGMIRQYEIEMGTYENPESRNPSQINWYYKDLRDAVYLGSTEDIAKSYYDAFDYVYQQSYKSNPGLTPKARAKKAHQQVMRSVYSMNPLNLSDELNGRYYSNKDHALDWIRKQPGGQKAYKKAMKAYNIFQRNLDIVDKIKDNRTFMQKYSGISELYMF